MKSIKLLFAMIALAISGLVWAGPVNVNTADAATLDAELVGVGPKIAEAIVQEREANGPYKDAADFKDRVKGVGDKIIEDNADNLRFSE
ncbi:ComEA family DNA-binding protein [Panacagrimonas sp.]|uniref:ComEA family DNA-binding protein n=1 Tax=Panacagrimonas sp. TaxID=2480088 RepID=UPI003B51E101